MSKTGLDFWQRKKLVQVITRWLNQHKYELSNLDIQSGVRIYNSKSHAKVLLTFYVPEEEG